MSVHTPLVVEIARQLNPRLLPRYVALTTRRFVMERAEDSEIVIEETDPDVDVVRAAPTEGGYSAAGTIAAPLRMATLARTPVPHITLEIRDVEHRQLVTVIEVLSPTNKRGDGYDKYVDERERILRSTAHLIEIDLLRTGRRVPMRGSLPSVPYVVFVSRREERFETEIWPIALDLPSPEIPVPLLPGDDDARLDLQQALSNVYDDNGLKCVINYVAPTEVPLTPEQDSWVHERFRAAGLHT